MERKSRLTNEIHDPFSDCKATGSDRSAITEIRATVNLYLDGKIRQWYSRGDGKGVVFLVEAKTEDEARAIMETLPLAKERLMDDQYVPVGPLMPLRALMGPGAQQ